MRRTLPPISPDMFPLAVRCAENVAGSGDAESLFVPSIIHGSIRIRAVHRHLFYRPPAESFHEFLVHHLNSVLGESWFRVLSESTHPLRAWGNELVEFYQHQKAIARPGDGPWRVVPTGHVREMCSLAYDIACLRQVDALPSDRVRRLRDTVAFWGVRYELAVAAAFVRASFRLTWCRDKGKHPEFIAEHPTTSERIAVEVKSRHRAAMHAKDSPSPPSGNGLDVVAQYFAALEQLPTDMPGVIFVESNVQGFNSLDLTVGARATEGRQLIDAIQDHPTTIPRTDFCLVVSNSPSRFQGSIPELGTDFLRYFNTLGSPLPRRFETLVGFTVATKQLYRTPLAPIA